MAFYAEMNAMVKDLLKPDTSGGLGQVGIRLVREVAAPPDPDAPWLGSTVETEETTLLAVASGVDDLADGVTILSTDVLVTSAVPDVPWELADGVTLRIEINGVRYSVVSVDTMPRAGTPVAVKFIVRDGHVNQSNPPLSIADS